MAIKIFVYVLVGKRADVNNSNSSPSNIEGAEIDEEISQNGLRANW